MPSWNWVKRSAIPGGALLLLFGFWALRSPQKDVPGEPARKARMSVCERNPHLPIPSEQTPLLAPPLGAEGSPRANPPDGFEVRKLVEDALADCRRALALHERTLGERAYHTLVKNRSVALACARECLKEAKLLSDRDAAERAFALLSLPPTHGLLKHFQW